MALRLSALPTGPLYLQEDSWYSFVTGYVDSTAIVRLEGYVQLKNPISSSGIEPATSRLAA
jgi:hypothetical protein